MAVLLFHESTKDWGQARRQRDKWGAHIKANGHMRHDIDRVETAGEKIDY